MQSRLPWLLAQAAAALAALLLRLASLLLALRAALVGAPPPPPLKPPPPRACAPAPPPHPPPVVAREAAFASAAGDAYGYGGRLSALRAREFSRLRGTAYVDHAGAALFSELQMADVARALSGTLLGNPRARPLACAVAATRAHAICTRSQRAAAQAAALIELLRGACFSPLGQPWRRQTHAWPCHRLTPAVRPRPLTLRRQRQRGVSRLRRGA
jgi:hypothetical protein